MDRHYNLINLIDDYQRNKCDQSFKKLFNYFEPLVLGIARKYGRSAMTLRDEIISELHEKIWWCVKNFDKVKSKDVDGYFKIHLIRAAIDVTKKKEGGYAKRIIPMDANAKENAATFEIADHLEEYEISKINGEIKTDQDKRQLIKALTKNSDALTTAIVKEHLSSEQPSARQIGRKLGVHHYTVTREIRKLSKNYDASLYGEINAFLVV
ncbi:sigma-70 family RNA polymerase sigma factor [Bacillus tequilensis]|uniref:sigma-70 family RNA polymerase sigma factor n=1 Tax=Bacillus tequilensis TaxID=227866 RepID=UPI00157520D0|nr:sigma-70 family RNA polymerase sigma factor [Bacillus tequilensis]NTU28362.1 sigma-70 family RNA polymerase sigma factor [Bacillus tequilensis]